MQIVLNMIFRILKNVFNFLNTWELMPGISFLSIIILSVLLLFLAKEILNNKE